MEWGSWLAPVGGVFQPPEAIVSHWLQPTGSTAERLEGERQENLRRLLPQPHSLHSVSVSSCISFMASVGAKQVLLWWQLMSVDLGPWTLVTLPLGFVPLP